MSLDVSVHCAQCACVEIDDRAESRWGNIRYPYSEQRKEKITRRASRVLRKTGSLVCSRSPRSWREKVIVLPAAMDWSLTCGRTEIKLIPVVVSGKRHEPRVPSPLP